MFIWDLIKLLLILAVLYISYKFALIPWQRLNFYKKQGLKTEFFPVVGTFITKFRQSYKEHGDVIYDLKAMAEKEPEHKAIVRNFGPTPVVFLFDPSLKKDFAFQHHNYEIRNFFGDAGKIFIAGLAGVKGDEWKKQRKIISQSFHFEFLKDNVPLIVNTSKELIEEIAQKNLKGTRVLKEMETIAGEIIGRVFFSENLKNYNIKGTSISDHLIGTLARFGRLFISPDVLLFGTKYVEKGYRKHHRELLDDVRQIEVVCKKIIEDRRKLNTNHKDLVWYLFESQKNPLEEDRLSDYSIIANYVVFIMAGTMTTAQLVAMTLYALTQNPDFLEKLREEIKNIYEKEPTISIDSLNQMNWLSALIKETLRMYNPAVGAGFKQASQDHKVGNINILKGTMVGASFVHSCFNPAYFENPWVYQPQRWIKKPNVDDPYVFTPFWSGPRNCIGQHLALIEAKVILCEFVRRFKFEMIEGFKLKLFTKIAYGPEDDLPMNLTPINEGQ